MRAKPRRRVRPTVKRSRGRRLREKAQHGAGIGGPPDDSRKAQHGEPEEVEDPLKVLRNYGERWHTFEKNLQERLDSLGSDYWSESGEPPSSMLLRAFLALYDPHVRQYRRSELGQLRNLLHQHFPALFRKGIHRKPGPRPLLDSSEKHQIRQAYKALRALYKRTGTPGLTPKTLYKEISRFLPIIPINVDHWARLWSTFEENVQAIIGSHDRIFEKARQTLVCALKLSLKRDVSRSWVDELVKGRKIWRPIRPW